MKFKYNNTPVRVKGLSVYCKDLLLKDFLTMDLKFTYSSVEDQHINPLNVFISLLQGAGGITDVEYEKGDNEDEENFIIH